MLGVAALTSRSQRPSMKEKATLSQELRTSRFPATHVLVGYYGQYRRSCHSECMTVTATTSCRTSGKGTALPPLPPLRTGRASFPASGSSLYERPSRDAAFSTTNPSLCTCRWQLGCSSTRLLIRSSPPYA